MFKLFSRPKSHEAKDMSVEKKPDTSISEREETVRVNHEDVKEDFGEVLDNLKEAIKIKEELGSSKISPEEVFQITGLSPEEVFSYLEGQHFAVDISNRNIIQEIESSLTNLEKEEDGVSGLRKFANNKMVKAAFVSLMLLAKMAPAAQAAPEKEEVKDEKGDHTEVLAYASSEKESDNTYYASGEEFASESEYARKTIDAKPLEIDIKETSRLINLEMANYFDTDSDYIPKDAMKHIKSDFEKFLERITPESAKELINSDFKLYGSSDERPTNNWKGGNEELTKARLEAVEGILSSFLQKYPFENLPNDLAEELRSKTFEKEMARSENGPEAGVTYVTDLVNPATGENYTEAEVNTLKTKNPVEYKKLLDDCRKISFEVGTSKAEEMERIDNRPPDIDIENPSEPPVAIEKLNSYQNVSLLFDNSPSVGNSYNYMADIVSSQDFDGLKVNFGTFSNHLDELKEYNNSQDVVKAIKKIRFNGHPQEKSLTAVKSALEKMPAGQKNIVFAMTDEPFQDVSWEKVQELKKVSDEKNAEVYFYYADDNAKVVRQIALSDIEEGLSNELLKSVSARVQSIQGATESDLLKLEKHYQKQVERLEKYGKKDLNSSEVKMLETMTQKTMELKDNIESQKKELDDLKAAWQNQSVEDLFASKLLQEKLGVTPNINFNDAEIKNVSGENLGVEVTSLSKVG